MPTALITGASSGIGKALAKIHAGRGGDLVLVARRADALESLKKELEAQHSINVTNFVYDLTKLENCEALYQDVTSKNIQIDYLMNNGGFGLLGTFHELSFARQHEMINLNILALTKLTHLFLTDMIKRESGKVLFTSSTASLVPGPLQAVYYATKAYVTSLGNALYEEYADKNISFTNLLPGATETEFGAISGMDKSKGFAKTVSADSVALQGYEAMMRGDLDVISGLTTMQKMMLSMVPFTPKKILLKNVRQFQEAR